MTDDDRRLAERLRRYESRVPDAEPRTTIQPHAMPWGAVAAVAAILVVVMVVGTNLIGRPPTSGEVSVGPSPSPTESLTPSSRSPEPSPSATPVMTPEPTATPIPSGAARLRWTAGSRPPGFVNAIRWMGDRWLAAGSAGGRATIWSSSDGLSWTEAPAIPPEPIAGPEGTGYSISDLVRFGDVIIAVGWNRIGCCDSGKPIAWTSTDGSTWEVLPTDGTPFEPHHFPSHLAIAPDGTLVVASHTALGSAWVTLTTRDLQTWERHEVTAPDSHASVSGVAASGSTLVAVGGEVVPGTDPLQLQRAWTSDDGKTWRDVDPPSTNGKLWGVTWDEVHAQFVAIGQDAESRPAVWRSGDGTAWSDGLTLDDGPGSASSIGVENGLIVVSGTLGDRGEALRAWTSYDGVAWQIAELGSPSGQTIVGVRPGGATIYVRGTTGEPDYRDVFATWAGEP